MVMGLGVIQSPTLLFFMARFPGAR